MACGCLSANTYVPYTPPRYAPVNPSCLPIHLRGLRNTCNPCDDCPPRAQTCAGLTNCGVGGALATPYGGCSSCGTCGPTPRTINNKNLGGCPGMCYGGDSCCGGSPYPNYPANCHPPAPRYNGGTRVIVRSNLACNGRATTIYFGCGGCETIPNAYIPDCGVIGNGTPILGCRWGTNPSPQSEGMDCPNYLFNHVNSASP
jgi:hypothetical protein